MSCIIACMSSCLLFHTSFSSSVCFHPRPLLSTNLSKWCFVKHVFLSPRPFLPFVIPRLCLCLLLCQNAVPASVSVAVLTTGTDTHIDTHILSNCSSLPCNLNDFYITSHLETPLTLIKSTPSFVPTHTLKHPLHHNLVFHLAARLTLPPPPHPLSILQVTVTPHLILHPNYQHR